MPQFRKKPVVIEAMQYTGEESFAEIGFWMGTNHVPTAPRKGVFREGCLFIQTLEGEMKADPGDWIIRGVKGEFYPCKPDIFGATYDHKTRSEYLTDGRVREIEKLLTKHLSIYPADDYAELHGISEAARAIAALPAAPADGLVPVYVKKWRTIFHVPEILKAAVLADNAAPADGVVEALREVTETAAGLIEEIIEHGTHTRWKQVASAISTINRLQSADLADLRPHSDRPSELSGGEEK